MAERTIWKGSISFGLVEIPVGLVSAENPSEIKLSFLDRRDFSPVGNSRYNKTTGEEVPWSEIVRGYEYDKGEYAVVDDADLRRANPKLTQTVNILNFVDAAEIEPIFYERPYYLQPLKKSKGYVLLRETLQRTGKVGIAKVAVRSRENIAVVGVREKALVLYLLRFAQEIRSTDSLEYVDPSAKDVSVQPQELQMAERLVKDMTTEWDPEAYRDEYSSQVMQVIEKKIASGKVHSLTPEDKQSKPARARGEIIDLIPFLKRSIAGEKGPRASPAPARSKKRSVKRPSPEPARKRSARRRSA